MKLTGAGGISLNVRVEGAGQPVVFLHEFAGEQRSWDRQFAKFSRQFKCIAPAARGYPPSDQPTSGEGYSQELMEQDVLSILDQLAIDKAHIVGLSMGAYTALQLALKHSKRCVSVVAASGGSGAYLPTREQFLAETLALADRFDAEGEIPAAVLSEGPTRIQLKRKDPAGWQKFVDEYASHPAEAAAMVLRGVQAARPSLYEFEEAFQSVEVPILLMVGDEDEPCLDVNLWLKRTIVSSRLVIIPNCGHAINLEEPELFNKMVADFITEVELGSWYPRDMKARAGGTAYGTLDED